MIRNAPHGLQVLRRQVAGDDDGSSTFAWQAGPVLYGWVSFLDATELATWQGEGVSASARVPSSAEVGVGDRLQVLSGSSSGTWQVRTVRRHEAMARVMLARGEA